MIINGVYICPKCNSTITVMTQEVLQFHDAHCEEWSKPIGHVKSVVQSENGDLWTTVMLQEYLNPDRIAPIVLPKVSKFKRWRKKIAKNFWNKIHQMAENHGADCDRYY